MELDTVDTVDSQSDTSGHKVNSLVKNKPMKYHGTKQQSELQRKINRSNLNKNQSTTSSIADGNEERIDASSSFDDNPKPIKIVKSTSTQITRTLNKRNKNYKTVSVTRLPQNFDCKYIGKTRCTGLWGLKHIRDPVDYLVNTSRKLKSLDELPDVEALISEKGHLLFLNIQFSGSTVLDYIFFSLFYTHFVPFVFQYFLKIGYSECFIINLISSL